MCAFILPLLALGLTSAEPTTLFRDGDRVVLLGSTFLEREQRYGYWETMLHARSAGRNLTVRNLGWSGDTVFGESRAGFESVEHGFRELKKQVESTKPSVVLIGYGANESFEGRAGLARFTAGLKRLLDALATTKARMVLLSPMRQENLGPPFPDVAKRNEDVRLYADAIRKIAVERKLAYVDLFNGPVPDSKSVDDPLTSNGMHLTAYGYWKTSSDFCKALGLEATPVLLELDAIGKVREHSGVAVKAITADPLRFKMIVKHLPHTPMPPHSPKAAKAIPAKILRIRGLQAGRHDLYVDGKRIVTASADEWAKGVQLKTDPDVAQAEKLRNTVIDKNRLFFHRWRPQNVTYLFGFRKHEQGNNAGEIPQFDPLVAKKDREIIDLAKPIAQRYELRPALRK